MDVQIEAFISEWMRKNTHLLEELVLCQGDDPTTAYGAAMQTYLDVAPGWAPRSYKAADKSALT